MRRMGKKECLGAQRDTRERSRGRKKQKRSRPGDSEDRSTPPRDRAGALGALFRFGWGTSVSRESGRTSQVYWQVRLVWFGRRRSCLKVACVGALLSVERAGLD